MNGLRLSHLFLDQIISHEFSSLPANLGLQGGACPANPSLGPTLLSWVLYALGSLPDYSVSVYPFIHPEFTKISLFSYQTRLSKASACFMLRFYLNHVSYSAPALFPLVLARLRLTGSPKKHEWYWQGRNMIQMPGGGCHSLFQDVEGFGGIQKIQYVLKAYNRWYLGSHSGVLAEPFISAEEIGNFMLKYLNLCIMR